MNKEGIEIEGIYKHFKGNYYKVQQVAYDRDNGEPWVIYNRCSEKGIYITIRDKEDLEKIAIKQPFLCKLPVWNDILDGGYYGFGNIKIPRFKLIKT